DLTAPIRTVASPIRLSQTPVAYDAPPPALGQDTDAVLGALGLDVADLRSRGVI
ncbi:MAG: CoA transferase, partial [Brevundimonas sp.]